MPAFGRPGGKDQKESKAPAMTYDGTNGRELSDWARDADLAVRFADRPGVVGGEARVLITDEAGRGDRWDPVPIGATIHQSPDGELSLELPAARPAAAPEEGHVGIDG